MGLRCPTCRSPMRHTGLKANGVELELPSVPMCERGCGAYIPWGPEGEQFVPVQIPEPGGRINYGPPLHRIERVSGHTSISGQTAEIRCHCTTKGDHGCPIARLTVDGDLRICGDDVRPPHCLRASGGPTAVRTGNADE